ncbi:hypothetical protein EMIT0P12_20804 [Pseudomonas sp. IT-P12]
MSGMTPDCAPSHVAIDTVAQSAAFTHLPLRGQRRDRGRSSVERTHSPASLFHSINQGHRAPETSREG